MTARLPMRAIAAVLFVAGIPWSLIAWIGMVGAPAAAIEDLLAALRYGNRLSEAILQIPFFALFALQTGLGYVIWAKWFTVVKQNTATSRRFWFVAAVHHLAWAVLASFANQSLRTPLTVAMFWYALVAMSVCLAAALVAGRAEPDPD